MAKQKIVCFLPVKGTSTRIANKNTQLMDGKPLFLHTLEKLMRCDFIDDVVLDTESSSIIESAEYTGCKILNRNKDLADNKTDGNSLLMNEINHYLEADIFIQILCTSPFIKESTIKKGIDILLSNQSYDSCFLGKPDKIYTWTNNIPNYDIDNIPNSSTLPTTIIETMGLYIIRKEAALKTNRRIGENPYVLEAEPVEAIDVNWPEDFALANLIAAGKRESERKILNNLKNQFSSPVLSDILDELGYSNQIIKGLSTFSGSEKIIGRAKTLHIGDAKSVDAQCAINNNIYTALKSYDFIVPGDIIIVSNDLAEYAYFGELNANLAIRAGAVGAIIGGKTRDSTTVEKLAFPVFSMGVGCQDIKSHGYVRNMNKPISILGVHIHPEDLVFGDNEGVVVIPKHVEHKTIELALKALLKEKKILLDMCLGNSGEDILSTHGLF